MYSIVPTNASIIVTVPLVPWVTPVIVGVFSKVSLVSTFTVLAVSSSVVCVSATISATGFIVKLITCVTVLPASSVMVTVKLSLPL